MGFFDTLPYEISLSIFQYLEASDLLNTAQVCQKFNQITPDNSLWIYLLRKDFNANYKTDCEIYGQYAAKTLYKLYKEAHAKVGELTGINEYLMDKGIWSIFMLPSFEPLNIARIIDRQEMIITGQNYVKMDATFLEILLARTEKILTALMSNIVFATMATQHITNNSILTLVKNAHPKADSGEENDGQPQQKRRRLE